MFEGSDYAYYGMYLVGFAIMMVVNLKTYKKYDLSKFSTVAITLITYVAGVTGAMIMGNLYTAIHAKYDENTTVAIFGAVVFTPIFMTLVALALNKPWRKVIDMLAPGIFIILTCAKFGCFMAGCCPGRECSFGVYNPRFELTMFPSQLFESITMCFVVAFCFIYAFKNKKCISGSVYPVTAAVYSVTRFCWEFMRYYSHEEMRHIMFGMTFWQFCCVMVIIISFIWILLLKSKRLTTFEEKYYSFVGGKYDVIANKFDKFKHRNDKNIVHHNKKRK
ncbi:MAG: prolipoprotein diacylglyceryl transferase [Clostridia bacterium]|nr:prolipoprotein diacylglyceryl transferase [Clostridia bacterium]